MEVLNFVAKNGLQLVNRGEDPHIEWAILESIDVPLESPEVLWADTPREAAWRFIKQRSPTLVFPGDPGTDVSEDDLLISKAISLMPGGLDGMLKSWGLMNLGTEILKLERERKA